MSETRNIGHTQDLKICQRRNRQISNKIQGNEIKRRLKKKHSMDLTKEIKHTNSKMVSTRYLAIKLEKFSKCPAGQIVRHKLKIKKNID